jgi:hypothetical protein
MLHCRGEGIQWGLSRSWANLERRAAAVGGAVVHEISNESGWLSTGVCGRLESGNRCAALLDHVGMLAATSAIKELGMCLARSGCKGAFYSRVGRPAAAKPGGVSDQSQNRVTTNRICTLCRIGNRP